jgi:lysophospholipase L1-like esterase
LHDPLIDLLKYTPEQRRKFRFERDIHLTQEGHEAIAASVAPVIKRILLTQSKEVK